MGLESAFVARKLPSGLRKFDPPLPRRELHDRHYGYGMVMYLTWVSSLSLFVVLDQVSEFLHMIHTKFAVAIVDSKHDEKLNEA